MEKCDCLNICGDDPRLDPTNRGDKVKPCAQWRRDQAAIKERQRVLDMVTALAKTASDNGTVYVSATAMDDIRRLINGLPTSGTVPNVKVRGCALAQSQRSEAERT